MIFAMRENLKKFFLNFLYLMPVFAVFILVVIFRERLTHIINPLIIAVLMFFVLNPLVERLEQSGRVKREVAIAVVFLITLVFIVGIGIFIIPAVKENIAEVAENIPLVKANFIELWEKFYGYLSSGNKKFVLKFLRNFLGGSSGDFNGAAIIGVIEDKFNEVISSVVAPRNILNIAKTLVDILTAFVITFYLLKDKVKAGNAVLSVFPYGWREFLIETYIEVERVFKSFVSGQIIIALFVGTAETIGLWLLDAPYPILLGLVGGISNMIPYFGPFIGAVPATIAMILVSPMKALFVILLFVLVQQIDNNFISPKIIEGKLGIHPVITILSVFVGGEFFGIAGMLLAVPIYAILRGFVLRVVDLSTKAVEKKGHV